VRNLKASVTLRILNKSRPEKRQFTERISEKNKGLLSDCNSSAHMIFTQSQTGGPVVIPFCIMVTEANRAETLSLVYVRRPPLL